MEVITNKKSANSKSQAGETFKWQPRVFPTSYVRSAHRPFTRRKLTFTSYPRALLEFAWSRVAPLSYWILTPREETAHHGIVQGHFFPSTLAGLKDVRTYSSCQVFLKKKKTLLLCSKLSPLSLNKTILWNILSQPHRLLPHASLQHDFFFFLFRSGERWSSREVVVDKSCSDSKGSN